MWMIPKWRLRQVLQRISWWFYLRFVWKSFVCVVVLWNVFNVLFVILYNGKTNEKEDDCGFCEWRWCSLADDKDLVQIDVCRSSKHSVGTYRNGANYNKAMRTLVFCWKETMTNACEWICGSCNSKPPSFAVVASFFARWPQTHERRSWQMETEFKPIEINERARRIIIGRVEAFRKLFSIIAWFVGWIYY